MSDTRELEARLRAMGGNLDSDNLLRATCFQAADALAAMRAETEKVQHLLRRCVVAFAEVNPLPSDYDAVNEAALYLKSIKPIPAAPKE